MAMILYLVPNTGKKKAAEVTEKAARTLREMDCSILLDEPSRAFCDLPDVQYLSEEECLRQADMILTIGGDGTILHEALMALPFQKPILGVNLGRCGFLATCEPDQLAEKMAMIVAGDYRLDERALLQVRILDGSGWQEYALNDVVISRGSVQHTIDFSIECDDSPVENYRGDGVVVATPTGSTAYSLAAGGPIVDSESRAMVLTPICPHRLQSVAMVFSQDRKLNIHVSSRDLNNMFLSCDGRAERPLNSGDKIEVTLSPMHIDLVSFGRADQFQAIDKKLKKRK